MNVPIEIAESGGETLRQYVKAVKEYGEVENQREQLEEKMFEEWKLISEKMKDYLILDELRTWKSMYQQSKYSRHLVKNLREDNPLSVIYEVEEHLKNLRHLILDERETAIKKEQLKVEIKTIREKA